MQFSITTLEPLIISQNSDDPNMCETLQYIRGTVIQGIFAQKCLTNNIIGKEFTRLIVSGDCIFSNAFPIENRKIYFPAPCALAIEKYDDKKIHNLLLKKINEQTKGISSLVHIKSNKVSPLTIRKEIRLHNQINDNTRISEDGKIFNYQSLPPGIVFTGTLTVKQDLDENTFKEVMKDNTILRMGRSATSEYGKVRFEWTPCIEDVMQPKEGQVIMTLLSETIVYNNNGFSSISQIDLNQYLENSTIEQSISRKSRIEGFINVWKLRKPSENVFSAGSSFLLNKIPSNSEYLINYGLGERTHEGYGQVSFSFLNATIDMMECLEWKGNELIEQSDIPTISKNILNFICLKRAKEKVLTKALEDAEKTIPTIKSNHLIGKINEMAHNLETFTSNLDILRKPAKDHLTKSYLGNQTILDHIKDISTGKIKLHTPETNSFLNMHESELKKLYFEQYFNQLRRKNKKNEKNGTW